MAKKKEYTIVCTHRGRETEYTGTVDYLVDEVFGYTLNAGASWQHERGCRKVNTHPTTARSLVTALNNAVHNTQGSCFDPDYYELKEG